MAAWFWYAVVAAVLYGAHQIFTRLASERIGDGLGGFVVEASAAAFILLYLAFLWLAGRWNQKFSMPGFNYSLLTGNLRRRRHDCVFSSLSKRWSAFRRSSHFSGWRRDYGHRGHLVFPRNSFLAATSRRCLRHRRTVFAS